MTAEEQAAAVERALAGDFLCPVCQKWTAIPVTMRFSNEECNTCWGRRMKKQMFINERKD